MARRGNLWASQTVCIKSPGKTIFSLKKWITSMIPNILKTNSNPKPNGSRPYITKPIPWRKSKSTRKTKNYAKESCTPIRTTLPSKLYMTQLNWLALVSTSRKMHEDLGTLLDIRWQDLRVQLFLRDRGLLGVELARKTDTTSNLLRRLTTLEALSKQYALWVLLVWDTKRCRRRERDMRRLGLGVDWSLIDNRFSF